MMKRITFRANEWQIARAKDAAHREGRSPSDAFREWPNDYGPKKPTREQIEALFDRLKYVNAGGKFTREEINER